MELEFMALGGVSIFGTFSSGSKACVRSLVFALK